jgi:Transposase DDE domain group 1
LPIHVYDTAISRPVAVILRPGKTPAGKEIRGHLRRLIRRIRRHWPATRITIRGDGHYGRPEVMAWCDDNAIDYVFGLPTGPWCPLSQSQQPPAPASDTHPAAQHGAFWVSVAAPLSGAERDLSSIKTSPITEVSPTATTTHHIGARTRSVGADCRQNKI